MLSSGDSSACSWSGDDKKNEEDDQYQVPTKTRHQTDQNSERTHTNQGSYPELDVDVIRLSPLADDISRIDRAISPLAVLYYGVSCRDFDQLQEEGENQPAEALANYQGMMC